MTPTPNNVPLLVTVFAHDDERSEWAELGVQNLARASGDNESEYTAADLKLQ